MRELSVAEQRYEAVRAVHVWLANRVAAMHRAANMWLSDADDELDATEVRAVQVAQRLFALPADQLRPAALLADGFVGSADEFVATWKGVVAARRR